MHRRLRLGNNHENRGNCSVRRIILVATLPILGFLFVMYEFRFLTTISSLEEIPKKLEKTQHIRNHTEHTKTKPRTIMILIANYRDSKRCGETLKSIFWNSTSPDDVTIGIHNQIYENEDSCEDRYCSIDPNCRRNQIRSTSIDAAAAKGPTVARYMTEELIQNEDFCMSIDSHLIFVEKWDTKVLNQWDSIENENAIITVYPKHTTTRMKTQLNYMCRSRIESADFDSMIQYSAAMSIPKTDKPRLGSQLAGGFNFGRCQQAKEIRNDPYTPFLFHGEEYSRAARLWTHGYDMYCPSEDIVFHWYEKRNVVWERNWDKRWFIQQKARRRIRYMLGLPVSNMKDIDLTNLKKFSLGTKRTMQQWKEFSKIDPLANFSKALGDNQFNNCKELKYVPYT